ncbi:MAG TPA: nucleotidyltransferase family protein [Gemmatimonadaceae bacterium]|nr:nucleotidyltransferase family protein [Gemmatimonadaceae bacterium]
MRWSKELDTGLSNLCVRNTATLFEALQAIDSGAESIVFVCDESGKIIGSLSDGDVRRALLSGAALSDSCLERVMNRQFAWVTPSAGRAEVLDIMRARDVGQLPVLDEHGRLCGLHTVGQIMSAAHRTNAAVILAGGRGTRLHPLTETVPKPMVTVAGRPILERLVLHLMSCGIRTIYISVNYLAHVIEEHFGDGSRFGCRIEYLREDQPLGTGGPLALVKDRVSEPVVVMNGDLVTQCDVGAMLDFHTQGGYTVSMGLRRYCFTVPFGVARVQGERLRELIEKPTERELINAGVYVLSPEVLQHIPRGREYPITELFNYCLREALPAGAFLIEEEWVDVGQHHELQRARGEQ